MDNRERAREALLGEEFGSLSFSERVAARLRFLLTDKYNNSEKLAGGIIKQELEAALSAAPAPGNYEPELLAIDSLIPREKDDLRSVYARVLEALGAEGPHSVVMASAPARDGVREATSEFEPLLRGELKHGRSCPAYGDAFERCDCGLKWRIRLQTEMTLRNAWEKRAYQAEAELSAAKEQADGQG